MSGTITQSIQFGVNNPLSQEGMSYKARFKKQMVTIYKLIMEMSLTDIYLY